MLSLFFLAVLYCSLIAECQEGTFSNVDYFLKEVKNVEFARDDSIFYNVIKSGEYEVVVSSISKEYFLNELSKHKKNIRTIYKGERINENVSENVYRSEDTLFVEGFKFIDRHDGLINYLYGDDLADVHLIHYREREVYLTNLYYKQTLKKMDHSFPFVSIAAPSADAIFSVEMEDYYLKPKGKFSLYSLTGNMLKVEFEYTCTLENNWMAELPFWVENNKILFILKELDDKGMTTGERFYASMTFY